MSDMYVEFGAVIDDKSSEKELKRIKKKLETSKDSEISLKMDVSKDMMNDFKKQIKALQNATGKKIDLSGITQISGSAIKGQIKELDALGKRIELISESYRRMKQDMPDTLMNSSDSSKIGGGINRAKSLMNESRKLFDDGDLEESNRLLNESVRLMNGIDVAMTKVANKSKHYTEQVKQQQKTEKEISAEKKKQESIISKNLNLLKSQYAELNKAKLKSTSLNSQMERDPLMRTDGNKETLRLLDEYIVAKQKDISVTTEELKANGANAQAVKVANEANRQYTIGANELYNQGKKNVSMLRNISLGFKEATARVVDYTLAYRMLWTAINKVKESIQIAKELDKTIVDLQIVTGKTRNEIESMMLSYNKLAREMGATTLETSKSANEFLRQGLNAKESEAMIKSTMHLAKLGMIESAEATKYLTSVTKGYNIEAENSMSIVDKLTKVDLDSAVSAGYIAEAMSRTSVSANLAGVSIDKLIGYISTVGSVSQRSASTVGEAFKTIFARLGNVKAGEFSSDGEDMENLNDIEKVVKRLGIQFRDTNNQVRDADKILDDVALKWESFSKIEKDALGTALAGVRQRESLNILFENYSTSLKSTESSLNSVGTAEQKMQAYSSGLEANINRLTASWEEMILSIKESDVINGVVKFGNAILNLTNDFNLLETALVTLISIGGIKGFKKLSKEYSSFIKVFSNYGNVVQTVQKVQKGSFSNLPINEFNALKESINALSVKQVQNIITTRKLSVAQAEELLTVKGLTGAELQSAVATATSSKAQAVGTATTVSFSAAMKGLTASIYATTVAWIASPIGAATLTIGAIAGIIAIIQKLNKKLGETRETFNSLNDAYEQTSMDIDSITSQIEELTKKIEELNKVKDKTPSQEKEIENLKIQTEEYKTQLAIKKEQAKIEAMEAGFSANDIYNQTWGKNNYKSDSGWTNSDYVQTFGGELSKQPQNAKSHVETTVEKYFNLREKLQSNSLSSDDRQSSNKDYIEYREKLNAFATDATNLINNMAQLTEQEKISVYGQNWAEKLEQSKNYLDMYQTSILEVKKEVSELPLDKPVVEDEDISGVTTEFDKLVSAYKSLNDTQKEFNETGSISLDTLKSLSETYPQLESSLSKYVAGLMTTEELLVELQKCYELDENNYYKLIYDKFKLNTDFYNYLLEQNSEIVDKLKEDYKIDLKNYSNLATAKLEVQTELQKKIKNLEETKSNDLINNDYNRFVDKILVNLYKELDAVNDAFEKIESTKPSTVFDRFKKSIDESTDSVDALKDAQQELEDAQKDYKDLIDLVIDLNKEKYEQQKDQLEDELSQYKKIIDAKKAILDADKKQEEYNKQLAERNSSISKLQERIGILSLDDSESARSEILKLQEEIEKEKSDLEDFQSKHSLDKQKEALDKEYKDFESIQKAKIDAISKHLSETGTLTQEAINQLKDKNSSLYNELIQWNKIYGDGITDTIVSSWDKAYQALSKYGSKLGSIVSDGNSYGNVEQVISGALTVGSKVKLNGRVYGNSYGENAGMSFSDHTGYITRINKDGNKPYHIDKLGWVGSNDIVPVHHKGLDAGFVGGVNGNEKIIKALKGELLINPKQQHDFINKHLPEMVSNYNNGITIGKLIEINSNGRVDETVIPKIQKAGNDIIDKLNNTLYRRGINIKTNRVTI